MSQLWAKDYSPRINSTIYRRLVSLGRTQVALTWWDCLFIIPACSIAVFWIEYTPSPGYAVALMALAAVLMAAKDQSKAEKTFWLLIAGILFWVEIAAIRKDRIGYEEQSHYARLLEQLNFKRILAQDQKHFEQTIKPMTALLNRTQQVADLAQTSLLNITGGSSFAYIAPQIWGSPNAPAGLVVWNRGNEVLTGVTVSISHPKDPNWGNEFSQPYSVGTIAPHGMAFLPFTITPKLDEDGLDHYWAMISAQNGTVDETIDFRRSKKDPRYWAERLRVSSRHKVNDRMTTFPVLMYRDWSDEGGKDLLKRQKVKK